MATQLILTPEQLDNLEEMGAALLSPSDIAIIFGIEADQRRLFTEMCLSHERSDAYARYQKGKMTTKFELRRTVVRLAKAGSPAAGPVADKYLNELE